MGGEKNITTEEQAAQIGSPPRGRGKGIQADGAGAWAGITPAWAGKRLPHPQRHQAAQDHPRVGGEKAELTAAVISAMGSPPRRRGKAGENHLVAQLPGITPAQAGKRYADGGPHQGRQDHPRVGGEKNKELEGVWLPMGSPPRGRGKDSAPPPAAFCQRITPAWAGKRWPSCSCWAALWDHPRVGGEKARTLIVQNEPQGSPPRGRGKARHLSHGLLPCG